MADPFISLCGHAAVRHPFRIPCLLRPRGLPTVFVLTTIEWPVWYRGSAMRGCVNVDFRDRRLLDCRGNCCCTFTFPTSVERAIDFSIRVERQCGSDGPAADGACLNVRPVHNYRGTRVFQVATRTFCGIHTLRLLGTHEAGGQFPHFDHDWCRLLFGFQRRSTTAVIPGVVQHFAWNVVGRKWDRYVKPIHRTKVRCAYAPYGAAARRSRPSQPDCCPGLRKRAGRGRKRVSCRRCQSAYECACDSNAAQLSVRLHTAETKNTALRSRRRLSRCHATVDRLGRRLWSIEYRSGDPFRRPFPLAVPTFH